MIEYIWEFAVLFESAVLVALGGYLLSKRLQDLAVNIVALRIAAFGLFAAMTGLAPFLPEGVLWGQLTMVALGVNYSFAFAVLVVYPDGAYSPWKRRLLGLCTLPTIFVAAVLAFVPELLFDAQGTTQTGTVFVFTMVGLFHFLAVIVFGWRYLASQPGARRTQLLYIAVPHLFLGLHDGLFYSAAGLGFPLVPPVFHVTVLGMLAVAAVPLVMVLAVWRPNWIPSGSRDDKFLLLALLLAVPLALVQFAVSSAQVGPTHLLVDFFAFVVLFYGVARFAVPVVDLKIRSPISRGTIAAGTISVLFIAQQVIQQYAGAIFGLAAGAVVAGIALSMLYPLQRYVEQRKGSIDVPSRGTDEYLTFRKFEIYKAALERAMQDGVLSGKEREILEILRGQLGITKTDAYALERDVLTLSESGETTVGSGRT